MTSPDPDRLYERARGAYERAMVRVGVMALWPLAVLVPLALVLHTPSTAWRTVVAGVALAGTVVLAGRRGGAWGRGIVPGLLGGLPAFFVPSLIMPAGATCARCVHGSSHWATCMTACLLASLAAGVVLAQIARRDPAPRAFAASAALCAGLTASLTCSLAGGGGILGVALGLGLASFPVLATGRRVTA